MREMSLTEHIMRLTDIIGIQRMTINVQAEIIADLESRLEAHRSGSVAAEGAPTPPHTPKPVTYREHLNQCPPAPLTDMWHMGGYVTATAPFNTINFEQDCS